MKNILDTYVSAYEGHSLYDFDNIILLNWYSYRIIEHSGNTKSILGLGLGHGLNTNIFSTYFDKQVVLEGSSAVIEDINMEFPDCHSYIIETVFKNYEGSEKYDAIVMGFNLEHVSYKQFRDPFVTGLSIADVLIFNAVEDIEPS